MLNKIPKIRKNRRKILGLNERYLEYIRPNNLRPAFEIADDKILTKELMAENEIPVPELVAVIRNRAELKELDFDELPKSFVIKPVHGMRGGGVEIFYNKDKNGNWIQSNGRRVSQDQIITLCRDILDGQFSLHNDPDVVLIEERIKPHKSFRYHTYKGTPDVRVIVYNSIPVMAMLRLPTEKSEGKANLDQGAIGVGIDLAAGKTTTAIINKNSKIEKIPHTKVPISGLKIPYWDKTLTYAIEASKASGLGFSGVDILIDKEKGPLIIELNARPGISIQKANRDGLRSRLKKANGIKVPTTAKGVRLAKDLFGGEIEEGIEALAGKNVIGIYESVKLFGLDESEIETKAKIDTGADSTSIDRELAIKLGYQEIIDKFDSLQLPHDLDKETGKELMKKYADELVPHFEYLADVNLISSSHGRSLRPLIKLQLQIDDTKFETKATIYDRSKLKYKVIVGRKSLFKFLVDPSKKKA